MEHPVPETTLEKLLLRQAAAGHRPVNGSLELLPLCNMNCDMCYVHLTREEMEKKGRLRSADEWICLAEEMARSGVLFLLLTGGEPLLFPDFQTLYRKLQKLGMILTVNTNGTLIDEEWAAFFGQNKPRRINITLYGADDRAYETLCHSPGCYTKVLRGIRLLKEQGIDVKINGSVTKANRQDMGAIYRLEQELDIPVHMDTYMLPGLQDRGKPFEEQARLLPEDAAQAAIQALKAEMHPDAFRQYVSQSIRAVENPAFSYPDHISCMAGRCSFTVNWQGEMRPCVSISEPSVPVFETGFEAAWQKASQEIDGFLLHSRCTSCRLRPVCNTCAASAFLETGQYDGIPEYHCRSSEAFLTLLYEEQAAFS